MPTEDADEPAEVERQGRGVRKRANAGPDHEPRLSGRNLRGAAAAADVGEQTGEPAETPAVWPLDEVQKAALGRLLGLINETGRDQPVG
jgi:hypothetical protein